MKSKEFKESEDNKKLLEYNQDEGESTEIKDYYKFKSSKGICKL